MWQKIDTPTVTGGVLVQFNWLVEETFSVRKSLEYFYVGDLAFVQTSEAPLLCTIFSRWMIAILFSHFCEPEGISSYMPAYNLHLPTLCHIFPSLLYGPWCSLIL